MGLSKTDLEREIKSSEAALKAHQEGIDVHTLVLKAFEDALILANKRQK